MAHSKPVSVLWRSRAFCSQLPRQAEALNPTSSTGKRTAPSLTGPPGLGPILGSSNTPYSPQTPFLVPVRLQLPDNHWLFIHAMLDSGAACCFMDILFAKEHGVPLQEKPIPALVEAIDGRLLRSGPVIQETQPLTLWIQQHQEQITFDLVRMPRFPVILGLSWLRHNNPQVDWVHQELQFGTIPAPTPSVEMMVDTPSSAPSPEPSPAALLLGAAAPALPATYHDYADEPFQWTPEADQAFAILKQHFATGPLLRYPDPNLPFVVEADASSVALGATAFEVWRHHLEGARHPVQVLTDHRNLEHLQTTRRLNQRQIRWSLFFSRFNFTISYIPQTQNQKADALSRKPEYTPTSKPEAPDTSILPPHVFAAAPETAPLAEDIRASQATDPWAQQRLQEVQQGDSKDLTVKDGVLYHRNRVYVPPGPLQARILRLTHDAPPAGHFGQHKTAHLLARDFWWPRVRADVDRIQELRALHELLREQLQLAKEAYKRAADRHRQEGTPLKVGDLVWLSTRYLRAPGRCAKLNARFIGPYKIDAQINPVAFRLVLPDHLKIHPVFHRSLLQRTAPPDPNRDTPPAPPPPVLVDDEEEYELGGVPLPRLY
ncbi:UNVERIFIED_CONTAM: hypothetical protein K2H54_060799 [Gekko kuhli]